MSESPHEQMAEHLPEGWTNSAVEVVRSDFTTLDRDEGVDALSTQLATVRPHFRGDGQGSRVVLQRTLWGPLALDRIGIWVDANLAVAPITELMVSTVTSGGLKVSRAGESQVQVAGQSCLIMRGEPPVYEVRAHDSLLVQVPYPEVEATASELTGMDPRHLSFFSMAPVSPAMNRYWLSIVNLIRSEMATPAEHVEPHRVAALMRLAAAGALAVFPNSTMTLDHGMQIGWVSPSVVAKAVDFIEEHAHEPIRLGQIAAAAGVGPRQLQLAFRRHLDSTPTQYLRSLRLNRAQERLAGGEVELTDLAREAGFGSPTTFSRAYREAFGRSPSTALTAAI